MVTYRTALPSVQLHVNTPASAYSGVDKQRGGQAVAAGNAPKERHTGIGIFAIVFQKIGLSGDCLDDKLQRCGLPVMGLRR